jgi:hypothetical protein
VRVYAVWFPVLPGDASATVDTRLLTDLRVTNFWDPKREISDWFSQHITDQPGITWDAYFLYGPGATWDLAPAPLASSGSPVIGSREVLAADFMRLTQNVTTP